MTLAREAVAKQPVRDTWNTLGVALYRGRDWKGAIEALGKSMELGRGGNCFDWFFLAMAHWRLGQRDEARTWYDKAVAGMENDNFGGGKGELIRLARRLRPCLACPTCPPTSSPGRNRPADEPSTEHALDRPMNPRSPGARGWDTGGGWRTISRNAPRSGRPRPTMPVRSVCAPGK